MNSSMMNKQMLINMIKSGGNPEQMVMMMLQEKAKENPMMMNLLQLAQSHNTKEIENVVRNVVEAQGGDYNQQMNEFRNNAGL